MDPKAKKKKKDGKEKTSAKASAEPQQKFIPWRSVKAQSYLPQLSLVLRGCLVVEEP